MSGERRMIHTETGDSVLNLDRPWSAVKVRILLRGESPVSVVAPDGQVYEAFVEGLSAYEQLVRAYDGGDPAAILEVAQLRRAIARIRDVEVRAMLALTVQTGESSYVIDMFLSGLPLRSTQRPAERLLERGVTLVTQIGRGDHRELLRVRSSRGESDSPVCWRCLTTPVVKVGDECGLDCPALPSTGRVGVRPRCVEEMTVEELSATQDEDPGDYRNWSRRIPGGSYYSKRVVPYGLTPLEPGEQWDVGHGAD